MVEKEMAKTVRAEVVSAEQDLGAKYAQAQAQVTVGKDAAKTVMVG